MPRQGGEMVPVHGIIIGQGVFDQGVPIGSIIAVQGSQKKAFQLGKGHKLYVPVGGRIVNPQIQFIGQAIENLNGRGQVGQYPVVHRIVTVDPFPYQGVQPVVQFGGLPIDVQGEGGVHLKHVPHNGPGIGPKVLGPTGGHVELHLQPIVKGLLGQVQPSGITFEVVGPQDSLLIVDPQGGVIGKFIGCPAHGEIDVLGETGPGQGILPIGIGAQIFQGAPGGHNLPSELIGTEDVDLVGQTGKTCGNGQIHLGPSDPALFGGDHDYPVGGPGAIYGSCRGILENIDALDVLGIDKVQWVGGDPGGRIVKGEAIDHIEGGGSRTQAAHPTDDHILGGSRFPTDIGNIDPGHFSL